MRNIILAFIFAFFSASILAQKARVKGVILDELNLPVENVKVKTGEKVTVSNENGFYSVEIEANKKVVITFSHVSFRKTTVELMLKLNEDFELNPVMNSKVEEFGEVFITANSKKELRALLQLTPLLLEKFQEQIPESKILLKHFLECIPIMN